MPKEQKKQKEPDCTDCLYFRSCYFLYGFEDKEDLIPCKDIVVTPRNKEQ